MSSKSVKLTTFKRPLIIAHRGYRAKYPENTLASFRASLDAGVQMIELDVMLSKDRKVVVIHDATLERTTNGYGSVSCYTIKELKALDAGSWFQPRFAGEQIPTLEEVLDDVSGRTMINIEIKASAFEARHPVDSIESQVVELVARNNLQASVLISSFEWKILDHIVTMKDAPGIALLSRHPADGDNVERCVRLKVFSWHPNCGALQHEQVKKMHEAGICVFPYNVDSQKEYQRMIQMDVDGVITSDPITVPRLGSVIRTEEC
jgi:glycerophosphoryl diester phosphodiesterase